MTLRFFPPLLALLALSLPLRAQEPSEPLTLGTPPASPEQVDAAAAALRDGLAEAFARGDLAAMGRFVHPDLLVVFLDGEVLRGLDELRAYHDRMLGSEEPILSSYESDPVIDSRAFLDGFVLSQGRVNDRYTLTDGTRFGLDSRFTATLVPLPDGPPETGGYVIRSFHASADAFDNPVLRGIAGRAAAWSAAVAGVVGLAAGAGLSFLAAALQRRRRTVEPAGPATA